MIGMLTICLLDVHNSKVIELKQCDKAVANGTASAGTWKTNKHDGGQRCFDTCVN